jgi:hypothetical protein
MRLAPCLRILDSSRVTRSLREIPAGRSQTSRLDICRLGELQGGAAGQMRL